MSDAALEKAIADALALTGVDLGAVRLAVLDGVVTLRGQVGDRRSQFRLEHAASQVKGVVDVENLLRVPTKRSS